MKSYKKEDMEIVRVCWVDSNTWGGWHNIASSLEWAENAILDCESVGYLVYEDKEKIVLAMGLFYGKDDDPALVASFSELTTIPKFAITKKDNI